MAMPPLLAGVANFFLVRAAAATRVARALPWFAAGVCPVAEDRDESWLALEPTTHAVGRVGRGAPRGRRFGVSDGAISRSA